MNEGDLTAPLRVGLEFDFAGRGGEDDGALSRLAAEAAAGVPPVEFWSYTNVGWCVLGRAFETATDGTWEDAMRHRLASAGMRETAFANRPTRYPTVVLVHGGPGVFDHSHFKPEFARLAEHAQVVYLALRGHGRSEWGDAAAWSFEACADDVRVFCGTLGIGKPIRPPVVPASIMGCGKFPATTGVVRGLPYGMCAG